MSHRFDSPPDELQNRIPVFDRTPDGFRVRAGDAADGTFSWRVVAKRKDIAGVRFERVEIPKEPSLPEGRRQSTPIRAPPDFHKPTGGLSRPRR